MKVVILLVCLAGIVVAEQCDGTDTTRCANEICAAGFVPTCVSNVCTCNNAPDKFACKTVADCNNYWSSHHCGHGNRLCMNGHCDCNHHHG